MGIGVYGHISKCKGKRACFFSADLRHMFDCKDRVAFGLLVKMESGRSGLAPLSTAENKEVHVRATQLRSL